MVSGKRAPHAFDPYALLDLTSDALYVVDRRWRIAYANRRACEQVGAGPDVSGRLLWEAFPELRATALRQALHGAMTRRKPVEAEEFHVPLGEWYALNAYPFGRGLAVSFRNVTRRRKHLAALSEYQERFRTMFETLTQGVVYRDGDGAVIDANPAAARILGMTLEEIRRHSPRDPAWQAIAENGAPLSEQDHPSNIALRTGRTVRNFVMGIFNKARGEIRWLSVDAIPQLRPGEPKPHQVYSIFSDITEQRRAEEALRASRAHLAAAQRVASVGSSEADFRTGEWQWSDETYRIYGLDKSSFKPTPDRVLELIHPDDRATFIADIEAAKRGIDPPPLEFRIMRADGAIRRLRREVQLRRDETGRVIGGIATKQDVTEVRESERLRDELQKQLRHAQRMDALGTLAGGIAHDLNNTLVPIIGLSEYLQAEIDPDDQKHFALDVIRQAGERARDLVSQILTFSRRESPDRQDFELSAFLADTMQLVRAGVPATIGIEGDFATERKISADRSQLHQVILNLVANASHAIGCEPGTIRIRAEDCHQPPQSVRTGSADHWVKLSIADTGCGMDEETKKRIYEPFFTTKPTGQGTGLGLSVVHGIVGAHGGGIDVTSEPGRGTCFDIYLPALAAVEDSVAEAAE